MYSIYSINKSSYLTCIQHIHYSVYRTMYYTVLRTSSLLSLSPWSRKKEAGPVKIGYLQR